MGTTVGISIKLWVRGGTRRDVGLTLLTLALTPSSSRTLPLTLHPTNSFFLPFTHPLPAAAFHLILTPTPKLPRLALPSHPLPSSSLPSPSSPLPRRLVSSLPRPSPLVPPLPPRSDLPPGLIFPLSLLQAAARLSFLLTHAKTGFPTHGLGSGTPLKFIYIPCI